MQRGQTVLVDTNIIIEAVRTKCWKALTTRFSIETVEKCCEEARTGQAHRPGYIVVDETALRTGLGVHRVLNMELATLTNRDPDSVRLDAGERHLWAHALSRTDGWIACCCDQAAIKCAVRLRWEDRLVSLEELVLKAGAKLAAQALKPQFSTARLTSWRTAALLERGLK